MNEDFDPSAKGTDLYLSPDWWTKQSVLKSRLCRQQVSAQGFTQSGSAGLQSKGSVSGAKTFFQKKELPEILAESCIM